MLGKGEYYMSAPHTSILFCISNGERERESLLATLSFPFIRNIHNIASASRGHVIRTIAPNEKIAIIPLLWCVCVCGMDGLFMYILQLSSSSFHII